MPKTVRSPRKATTIARSNSRTVVLVGTRKGAWIFHADAARAKWRVDGPHFLGQIVHHLVLDPRDGRTLLAASRTGHLGPTLFRSPDAGKTWTESKRPPAFDKAKKGEKGRVVHHTFWLTPGHTSEPRVWWAGTSPQGLFRSTDAGATWEPVTGFNDDPAFEARRGGGQDGTPDGPKLHSILIDPRDAKHMYLGMSGGGIHESRDQGRTWTPLVDGCEVVGGFDPKNIAFHDPHCMRIAPSNPDRLYHQNHCGIYRIDRPSRTWKRVGKRMPKDVGDIGFVMNIHPRDADTAWVFPMDGSNVWPRTSPAGKPAVYVTRDGGAAWKRLDKGLPREQAWWTVKRQAMTCDARDPVGLYLGTTSGELWGSVDEGKLWSPIAQHLPEIYSVEAGEFAQ